MSLLPSSGPAKSRGMPLLPGSLIELRPSAELDLTGAGMEFATFSLHAGLRLRGAGRLFRAGSAPSTRVSDAAMKFGFWHLGLFAIEYRRHSGESPIETLSRRELRRTRFA